MNENVQEKYNKNNSSNSLVSADHRQQGGLSLTSGDGNLSNADFFKSVSEKLKKPDLACSSCPLEILLFIQAEIPASAEVAPDP